MRSKCVLLVPSLLHLMTFFYSFRNQNVAKKLFGVLFAAFSVLVVTIALRNEFTPAYDVMHTLGNALYIAPWSRIIPYMVGVAAGWILFTTNGKMPFQQVSMNNHDEIDNIFGMNLVYGHEIKLIKLSTSRSIHINNYWH